MAVGNVGASENMPPRVRWVDNTDADGERGGFNVLHQHEALVRAFSAAASDAAQPLTKGGRFVEGTLPGLLHERCTVHVRDGDFDDAAPELCESARGRAASAQLLLSEAAEAPILRMEPAELLPRGETRSLWHDTLGNRHGLNAVWSVTGLALHLVWVVEPPPTHREWCEALQHRSPAVSALLSEDVVLHDAEGGGGGASASECTGAARVLPRLLRWATDAAVATFGQTGDTMQLSRTKHIERRRTRVSIAGRWPIAPGGEPLEALLEETLEWRYVRPRRGTLGPTAAAAAGSSSSSSSRRRRRGGGGLGMAGTGWQVCRLWRRTLALPDAHPSGGALPMNVFTAAALAGSTAMLYGPLAGNDDDEADACEGDGREGAFGSKVYIDLDAGGYSANHAAESDEVRRSSVHATAPTTSDRLCNSRSRSRTDSPMRLRGGRGGGAIAGVGVDGADDVYRLLLVGDETAGATAPSANPALEELMREEGERRGFISRPLADAFGEITAEVSRDLELKVEAEVRAVRVRQRWGTLSLRLRVRGAVALARASLALEAESSALDREAAKAQALEYAGLRLLTEGARAGEMLDTFEMAQELLRLQHVAGAGELEALTQLLSECVQFHVCSGDAEAPPSDVRFEGRSTLMAYLKAAQIPRTRRMLANIQPSAMRLDGRTSTSFEIHNKAGETERFLDVIGWDAAGHVSSWVRVREPRPMQRDFLQMVGAGRTRELPALFDLPRLAFAIADGHACKVYADPTEARAALLATATRLGGRIAHIGRTRELRAWTWPEGMPSPPKPPGKPGKPPAPAARLYQAILIGTFRPLGAKWYGEQEVAMRETAEWRGTAITRVVWEVLSEDHPQAQSVWERLRAKRRRAKQTDAQRPASAAAAALNRPAWSDAIAKPPALSKGGLKTAKDKEMAPRPKDLGLPWCVLD